VDKRSNWIFQDKWSPLKQSKSALLDYLVANKIQPKGHFKDDLEEDEILAWRFPAYAITKCPHNKKLLGKIKTLAIERGTTANDKERNYQNQLVEFHALYVLTALMGYEFIGWDIKSNRSPMNSNKDCDIHCIKNGIKYFVEVKDCSSEIMTQQDSEAIRNDTTLPSTVNSVKDIQARIRIRTNQVLEKQDLTGIVHYTPKIELTDWINRQIKLADAKDADILICHPTGWGLPNLLETTLKRYCEKSFPASISWNSIYPHWKYPSKSVKKLILMNRLGCWNFMVSPLK
jgi:hypothetical protein